MKINYKLLCAGILFGLSFVSADLLAREHDETAASRAEGMSLLEERKKALKTAFEEQAPFQINWKTPCQSLVDEVKSHTPPELIHPSRYYACLKEQIAKLSQSFEDALYKEERGSAQVTFENSTGFSYVFNKTGNLLNEIQSPPAMPEISSLTDLNKNEIEKLKSDADKSYFALINFLENIKQTPEKYRETTKQYMGKLYVDALNKFLDQVGKRREQTNNIGTFCRGLNPRDCTSLRIYQNEYLQPLLSCSSENQFGKDPFSRTIFASKPCLTKDQIKGARDSYEDSVDSLQSEAQALPAGSQAQKEKLHGAESNAQVARALSESLGPETPPTEAEIAKRVENLNKRLEVFKSICMDDQGKLLGEERSERVIVEDNTGNKMDCLKESAALNDEMKELGMALPDGAEACGGQDAANKEESSCLSELGCNFLRSAVTATGAMGLVVHKMNKLISPASTSSALANCIDSNRGDCSQSFLVGIFDNLWGTITGVWDLAVLAVKKAADATIAAKDWVVNTWNRFWSAEDSSSDKMQAMSTAEEGFIKRFINDPVQTIKETGEQLYKMVADYIRDRYMCARWSGTPFVSDCLEKSDGWSCATCDQKLNAICGVSGVVAGEIAAAFFTGGAASLAKGAATSAKVGQVASKLAKVFPKLAKIARVTKYAGVKLSEALIKTISAIARSPVGKAISKGAELAKKGVSKTVARQIMIRGVDVNPITAYFRLMEDAFKLGVRSGDSGTAVLGQYANRVWTARKIPRLETVELAEQALARTAKLTSEELDVLRRAYTHGVGDISPAVMAEKARILINGGVAKTPEEAQKILNAWHGEKVSMRPVPLDNPSDDNPGTAVARVSKISEELLINLSKKYGLEVEQIRDLQKILEKNGAMRSPELFDSFVQRVLRESPASSVEKSDQVGELIRKTFDDKANVSDLTAKIAKESKDWIREQIDKMKIKRPSGPVDGISPSGSIHDLTLAEAKYAEKMSAEGYEVLAAGDIRGGKSLGIKGKTPDMLFVKTEGTKRKFLITDVKATYPGAAGTEIKTKQLQTYFDALVERGVSPNDISIEFALPKGGKIGPPYKIIDNALWIEEDGRLLRVELKKGEATGNINVSFY